MKAQKNIFPDTYKASCLSLLSRQGNYHKQLSTVPKQLFQIRVMLPGLWVTTKLLNECDLLLLVKKALSADCQIL